MTLNGKTFLKYIADKLTTLFDKVIILSDKIGELSFVGLPVYPDLIKNAGPLGGIYTALTKIDTKYAFVISCDMPLFPIEAANELINQACEYEITIAADGGNTHPLFAIYPKSIASDLESYILKSGRKVLGFLSQSKLRLKKVDLTKFQDKLININSVSDYKKLLSEVATRRVHN